MGPLLGTGGGAGEASSGKAGTQCENAGIWSALLVDALELHSSSVAGDRETVGNPAPSAQSRDVGKAGFARFDEPADDVLAVVGEGIAATVDRMFQPWQACGAPPGGGDGVGGACQCVGGLGLDATCTTSTAGSAAASPALPLDQTRRALFEGAEPCEACGAERLDELHLPLPPGTGV